MAVLEKTGNEILLEQLTKQVAKLASEQKAKEAVVKELNEQIRIAERDATAAIAKAKAETEKECAALKQAVAPLKDTRAVYEGLRTEIEQMKRTKLECMSDAKSSVNTIIKESDIVLARHAAKLGAIEKAIDECKRKVAAL